MMPSHHHHLCRRGLPSDRRRHIIPFGHPYSCTPVLNAIFEYNPSPSHAEVTKIIQQTGLRRKQITSWFWRKRKESIGPEEGDMKHVQFPKPSSSHLDQAATPRSCLTQSTRHGKPRDAQDEEYRTPSYAKTHQRAYDRSAVPDLTPSSPLSKAKPVSIRDQTARTVLPIPNQTSSNPNPSSKPKSQSASSCHVSPPVKPPILIRCRLRPLAQRVLNESIEWDRDESNESNTSACPGGSRVGSGDFSSDIKFYIAPKKDQVSASTPSEPCNDSSSSSAIKQDKYGAVLSSTHSPTRNLSDKIVSIDEPSEFPCPLPINPQDPQVIMEEMRLAPTPSSTASPHQRENVSNLNPRSPDPRPANGLCSGFSDICRCQLSSRVASCSQEYSVSTARLIGAGKTGWLRPNRRLSYPGSGQVGSISRNNSNAFRESSSDSIDSSASTQIEAGQGICLRVSQEDLDLGSNSNLSTSSLGHEVHRWSELSEVDGASRYSSVSIESRASRCTNAPIEDYSALLSTSDKIMMCESPTAREELEATKGNMRFQDDRSPKNLSMGTRSISNPYHPLKQTSQTTAGFQENKELPFPPSTCLLNQELEVEEDPRLFVVQRDHQEFFDLLDWNPLGSFLNSAS